MARTSSKKAASIVLALARYFIKKNGHVVYLVLASNGKDTYCTTIINGKATGCTCPSYKPCKHMKQMEAKEQEREQAPKPAAPVAEETTPVAEVMEMANIEMDIVIEQAAAKAERANELKLANWKLEHNDAYAVLGSTKKVSVPTAEYDSCAICGCRIAVGTGYCKRC